MFSIKNVKNLYFITCINQNTEYLVLQISARISLPPSGEFGWLDVIHYVTPWKVSFRVIDICAYLFHQPISVLRVHDGILWITTASFFKKFSSLQMLHVCVSSLRRIFILQFHWLTAAWISPMWSATANAVWAVIVIYSLHRFPNVPLVSPMFFFVSGFTWDLANHATLNVFFLCVCLSFDWAKTCPRGVWRLIWCTCISSYIMGFKHSLYSCSSPPQIGTCLPSKRLHSY